MSPAFAQAVATSCARGPNRAASAVAKTSPGFGGKAEIRVGRMQFREAPRQRFAQFGHVGCHQFRLDGRDSEEVGLPRRERRGDFAIEREVDLGARGQRCRAGRQGSTRPEGGNRRNPAILLAAA